MKIESNEKRVPVRVGCGVLACVLTGVLAAAQPAGQVPLPKGGPPPVPAETAQNPVPVGITPPADYVIGADDVLAVVFWRDKEISSEVTVRPDGKISLPLLNDVRAAGLTPEQLRDQLVKAASASAFIAAAAPVMSTEGIAAF